MKCWKVFSFQIFVEIIDSITNVSEELFLMVMFLSLSLVRARTLNSLVNHGEYLSEILSSVVNLTNERRYDHLLTALSLSYLN